MAFGIGHLIMVSFSAIFRLNDKLVVSVGGKLSTRRKQLPIVPSHWQLSHMLQ